MHDHIVQIVPLPFYTLHKKWTVRIVSAKLKLSIIAFLFLLLSIFFLNIILHLHYFSNTQPLEDFDDLAGNIFAGIIGGALVSIIVYLNQYTHVRLHYARELQIYVNKSQNRYKITLDEAGALLNFKNDYLITIDNFFRYLSTPQEATMLPRIQKFGELLLPLEGAYTMITFFWQTEKGFFLTEKPMLHP